MKKILLLLLIATSVATVSAQSVIFLHHSTGSGVYNGGVAQYFADYNSNNATEYEINERAYPDSPYPWNNYSYDFWNLWVNGGCDSEKSGIECLNTLAEKYDVIIWKHCYPGADVVEDDGKADVSSSKKTLANYKLQYNALKTEMAKYPDTKFIVWTLAPRHRLATNEANAARAREFVDWVNNDWLSDAPANIYIFDFFAAAAEYSENPENGAVNCLKYEYEGSHSGSDSHPNSIANKEIAPIFAQRIIDVIEGSSTILDATATELSLYPNPANDIISLPEELRYSCNYKIYSIDGSLISQGYTNKDINIAQLHTGSYILLINGKAYKFLKD